MNSDPKPMIIDHSRNKQKLFLREKYYCFQQYYKNISTELYETVIEGCKRWIILGIVIESSDSFSK